MAMTPLSKLQAGMVTTEPVEVEGRVIVGKGVAITEKMLQTFKAWGVLGVHVEGENEDDPKKKIAEMSDEIKNEVKNNFNRKFGQINPKNKIMLEIKRVAIEKALQRYA